MWVNDSPKAGPLAQPNTNPNNLTTVPKQNFPTSVISQILIMAKPGNITPPKTDRFTFWLGNTLGSPVFLVACFTIIVLYILWNLGYLPGLCPFDGYPFSGLEMVVSVFAIFLSVTVLISQNRQRKLEKVREEVEFEINVRAEREITKVLDMLHRIQRKLGIDEPDEELEKMKQNTDVDRLHEQVSKEAQDK